MSASRVRSGVFYFLHEHVIPQLPTLKPLESKVLLVLMKHADRSGVCWPSNATICKLAGCKSRSRICGAMRGLEQRGMVKKIEREQRGRMTAVRQLSYGDYKVPCSSRRRIRTSPTCASQISTALAIIK